MRSEVIDLFIFSENGNALSQMVEVLTELLKLIESPFCTEQIAFAKEIRNIFYELALSLNGFYDEGRNGKRPTITFHFVIVPVKTRITCRIIVQTIFGKVQGI